MTTLILAPHTDDAEFGCGGTIARHVEEGHQVHVLAFSKCGLDQLELEFTQASNTLGAHHQLHDFPVRRFGEYRQHILDLLLRWKANINPDRVYLPSPSDMHQDHEVIANEAIRAFKHCTLLAYEVPWNNLTWRTGAFTIMEERHMLKKLAALACYRSQEHRAYANEEYIRALARVRGLQANTRYAECFDTIRWIN